MSSPLRCAFCEAPLSLDEFFGALESSRDGKSFFWKCPRCEQGMDARRFGSGFEFGALTQVDFFLGLAEVQIHGLSLETTPDGVVARVGERSWRLKPLDF